MRPNVKLKEIHFSLKLDPTFKDQKQKILTIYLLNELVQALIQAIY